MPIQARDVPSFVTMAANHSHNSHNSVRPKDLQDHPALCAEVGVCPVASDRLPLTVSLCPALALCLGEAPGRAFWVDDRQEALRVLGRRARHKIWSDPSSRPSPWTLTAAEPRTSCSSCRMGNDRCASLATCSAPRTSVQALR